ncbi:hypothetical protein LCY76_23320 [Fictibacillus sp. KIGAM418]|uniref:Uncharacterized protein n=1 Tax=Fictibacillus marinisediminis TaxID=2878389 RepID=A0A9X1XGI7_9BACL|nr:hypothetical protein [Fictibacillus marinisediminis]MCK6259505.1 hypothetical protein [Fictibacillus marinisediminis]
MGTDTFVSILLEGITKYSGILLSTRDKYLKQLKGFNIIGSIPEDFCLDRTNSSTYWIKESSDWLTIPNYNFPKRKVYDVSTHIDYTASGMEAT